MSPDSKKTKLGCSNQQTSPLANNTDVDLAPCRALKCVSTAISGGVDIPKVPRCHLLHQM